MERTKLKRAREDRKLKQWQVADAIGCSRDSIGLWERGQSDPQDYWIRELCTFFDKESKELDLYLAEQIPTLEDIIKMLEHLPRREVVAMLQKLPAFAAIDLSVLLLDLPSITPEEFLSQCAASLKACWHLLQHDGLPHVDNILAVSLPKLSEVTAHSSPYRGIAASLMTEARILQVILAGHRLDFVTREIRCMDAVRFGQMSGNKLIHAVALAYLGYHYWAYVPDSGKAISAFNDGLKCIGSSESLQRSVFFVGLAGAYAQMGDEKQARDYVEQAREAMPKHPEQDPYYTLIDIGPQELCQYEGRVFLALDEHYSDQGHARTAYNAFVQGSDLQAISDRTQSETLIQRADAARGIGELHHFLECLEQGIRIAFQIGSKKRINEAVTVLHKAPEAWHKEQKYQDLVNLF